MDASEWLSDEKFGRQQPNGRTWPGDVQQRNIGAIVKAVASALAAPPAFKPVRPRQINRLPLQEYYASLSDEGKAAYRAKKKIRLPISHKGSVVYPAIPSGGGTLATVTAEVEVSKRVV